MITIPPLLSVTSITTEVGFSSSTTPVMVRIISETALQLSPPMDKVGGRFSTGSSAVVGPSASSLPSPIAEQPDNNISRLMVMHVTLELMRLVFTAWSVPTLARSMCTLPRHALSRPARPMHPHGWLQHQHTGFIQCRILRFCHRILKNLL